MAKREVAVAYLHEMSSSLGLAETLATVELLHNNWKASFDWYEQVMAVTSDDVKRMADKYLLTRSRTVGMIEKEESK